MSESVSVRLVSVDDVDEITALVARNLEFLAPWDPPATGTTPPRLSNDG